MSDWQWCAVAPMRNCARTVDKCISSLLWQSVRPAVVVAIDDGSTDGTGDVLDKLAAEHDNLRVLHTKSETRDYSRLPKLLNLGRDVALRHAHFDYQLKAAGDVFFGSHYIQRLLHQMEINSKSVMCTGKMVNGGILSDATGDGTLIRTAWFEKTIGNYPESVIYEGLPMWLAIVENGWLVDDDAVCVHLEKTGHGHNFKDWGAAMRAQGYYPPFVLWHCLYEKNWRMFWEYVTYRDRPGTFYSSASPDVRRRIGAWQKQWMWVRVRRRLLRKRAAPNQRGR